MSFGGVFGDSKPGARMVGVTAPGEWRTPYLIDPHRPLRAPGPTGKLPAAIALEIADGDPISPIMYPVFPWQTHR
jgi:hypothetical protein